MDDLTKEQQKLLVSLYKEMLSRQPACAPEDANFFLNSIVIRDQFLPGDSYEHVTELCWALKRNDYITCDRGDNLPLDIRLTDKTIICMENRFKNGIKGVLNFLLQFKP